MPIRMSVKALQSMIPTQATAAGPRQRANRPNPNDAMSTYARQAGSPPAGTYGASPIPDLGNDPRQPANRGMLRQAGDQLDQEYNDRQAQIYDDQAKALPYGDTIGTSARQIQDHTAQQMSKASGWGDLLTALKLAGVDTLNTGAVEYGDNPGFIDQIAPHPSAKSYADYSQQAMRGLAKAKDSPFDSKNIAPQFFSRSRR